MREFIDKEALLFEAPLNFRFLSAKQFKKVIHVLRLLPTVTSAEIVVLCKDCKFSAQNKNLQHETGKGFNLICFGPETPFFGHKVKDCGFCCYGKRKEKKE